MSAPEDLSLKERYERRAKLAGGYAAFVAALLVATIAKSGEFPRVWLVVSLLAASLPSLVALSLLDFHVLVGQRRRKSAMRGLAFALGFFPSVVGVAILIGHFSRIGAGVFLLLVVFWALVIYAVAIVGYEKNSEA
jgi:hypothetical protein